MIPTEFHHQGYSKDDIENLIDCFHNREPYIARFGGRAYECKVVSMEQGGPNGVGHGWFPACDYLFELVVISEGGG